MLMLSITTRPPADVGSALAATSMMSDMLDTTSPGTRLGDDCIVASVRLKRTRLHPTTGAAVSVPLLQPPTVCVTPRVVTITKRGDVAVHWPPTRKS